MSRTDAVRARPPNGGPETDLLVLLPLPTLILDEAEAGPTIASANPALLALTGRGEAELVGQPIEALACRHGDHAGWAPLREALARGETGRFELLLARGDGASFWGEIHLAALPGADEAPRFLSQIVDVTRRRDAEDALALSRQREALGLLTNSVAHEFNNFLQILIGYIDGLKRRLGDRPEPFIQRAITRSTEASERAAVLTRQLLAHSRRIAPDLRSVDLGAAVQAGLDRLRPSLPSGIDLDLSIPDGLPPALCNPIQLELALGHILTNACEAMAGRGRIRVALFAVEPGDRSLQRPEAGAVGLTVSDNGHGLSPEMLSRALAPFATTRESGRGAGLAIVHGLMKRQNGTISIESRPGEGATVRLVFPAAR
ncbi:nitrogen regulation protein NR(II) [Methylobacterium sp. R2-1]|uniref:two-component system sensor histidine kinase NtrB n=1 Tax=Methylobacterium sp. R2-1 TaxID=2587064 RepID=UPI001616FDC7|nr:ATP-binding protein [Methylobacterium sp. R2-1]MBB2963661.1 PAS domain S-box-containing protein [Methylobacterium sp. R2-1]